MSERLDWFDPASGELLIDTYVQQMPAFIAAMEDGVVDESELEAQETQLITLMREVEPQLDDATQATVTKLLTELACLGLMQTISAIQQVREMTAQAAAE
jgi:hypothetical protein